MELFGTSMSRTRYFSSITVGLLTLLIGVLPWNHACAEPPGKLTNLVDAVSKCFSAPNGIQSFEKSPGMRRQWLASIAVQLKIAGVIIDANVKSLTDKTTNRADYDAVSGIAPSIQHARFLLVDPFGDLRTDVEITAERLTAIQKILSEATELLKQFE